MGGSHDRDSTDLDALIDQLESERAAATARAGRWSTGIAAVGLLIVVAALIAGFPGILALFVLGFTAVFVFGSRAMVMRPYAEGYKTAVVNHHLKERHPELNYQPGAGLPREAFNSTRLFKRPDRFSSEDGFSGRIGSTAVRFSEVHAEERHTDSKGRTSYSTIFRGLLFQADFNKHFSGTTIVKPDLAERALGRWGRSLQSLRPFAATDLVHLEHPEFEKYFKVTATDQVEARYLLTPDMLERLLRVRAVWSSSIWVSFHSETVSVAIEHGDLFEVSTRASADDAGQLGRLAREVDLCCSLVEDLDLNRRIWTKE